jgi:hypothetical protein
MKHNPKRHPHPSVPVKRMIPKPNRAPDLILATRTKNPRDGVPKTMPLIANITPAKESDNGVEVQLYGIDASRPPLLYRYHVSEEMVCRSAAHFPFCYIIETQQIAIG